MDRLIKLNAAVDSWRFDPLKAPIFRRQTISFGQVSPNVHPSIVQHVRLHPSKKKKSAAAEYERCTRENLLGNGTLLMIGRQLIHAAQG